MAAVNQAWDRIHNWLAKNAPAVNASFKEGASDEEIQKLEDTIGTQLPEDFKASYRIHNGSSGAVFEEQCFQTIEEIIADWTCQKEVLEAENFNAPYENLPIDPTRKMQDKWWDPKWIPFTSNGCGDALVIDLAPAEAGTKGQVCDWIHDGAGDSESLAASFTEYLEMFATDLEAGKYKVRSDNDESLEKIE